jgi:hypothetical protein
MNRHHFAYGSNLSFADLARSRHPELSAILEPRGPVWLPDRELAFTRYS